MLSHTLQTLSHVNGIGGILVVSRDSAALSLARQLGAQTLQESGAPELNASLTMATQVVSSWNASGVLLLASDIPLLQVSDIENMIARAKHPPVVVIGTDRRVEGTNAMLIKPPGIFPYRFGVDSLNKHKAEAEAIGADVYVYQSPTLGLDVDVPADLDLYREMLVEQDFVEPAWLVGA